MIKNTPITHNISELIPKVAAYLASRKDVLFSYLFGSYAGESYGPFSDVDIAVYLSGVRGAEKRLEILGDLNKILKTDELDLVILNEASLSLRMNIIKNGRLLSDNAPYARHSYESITTRSYLDFAPVEKAILERRFSNG
jgi:uncharacterized protein